MKLILLYIQLNDLLCLLYQPQNIINFTYMNQQNQQTQPNTSFRPHLKTEHPISSNPPAPGELQCQPITHAHSSLHNQSESTNNPSKETPTTNKQSKEKNHSLDIQSLQSKLSSIIKQKKDLSQEMSRLQYQQSRLKEKEKKSVDHLTRSHITKEEIHKIHDALQARKEFEEAVARKLPQLEHKIKEKIEEEQQEERKILSRQQINHKEEALHQLELLKQRREEREKEIKERNKTYQIVRHKKYAHEKIEQQWEQEKKKEKDRQKLIKVSIHHQRQFSIKEITTHQRMYQSHKEQDSLKREKKFTEMKKENGKIEKATLTQFQPSAFLRTIFEQEENRKRELDNKNKHYRTYSLKKAELSENVKEMNRSRWKKNYLKPIQEGKDKEPSNSKLKKRSGSLSQVELFNLGNSYMREIHSSIGHIETSKIEIPKLPPAQIAKHDDYLTKMRMKRQQEEKKSRVMNPEAKQLRQFNKVMKKSVPVQDKLYYVKLLTSKMEEKAGKDTKMMVASINAKLQMINQLVG